MNDTWKPIFVLPAFARGLGAVLVAAAFTFAANITSADEPTTSPPERMVFAHYVP